MGATTEDYLQYRLERVRDWAEKGETMHYCFAVNSGREAVQVANFLRNNGYYVKIDGNKVTPTEENKPQIDFRMTMLTVSRTFRLLQMLNA